MKGIVICGFLKCGTTSLLEYLKVKYKLPIAKEAGFYDYDFEGKISRREWCYLPYKEQMERFHKVFGKIEDFQLVYITREPVERVWSNLGGIIIKDIRLRNILILIQINIVVV